MSKRLVSITPSLLPARPTIRRLWFLHTVCGFTREAIAEKLTDWPVEAVDAMLLDPIGPLARAAQADLLRMLVITELLAQRRDPFPSDVIDEGVAVARRAVQAAVVSGTIGWHQIDRFVRARLLADALRPIVSAAVSSRPPGHARFRDRGSHDSATASVRSQGAGPGTVAVD